MLAGYTLTTTVRDTHEFELVRGHRDRDGMPVVVKRLRGDYPPPLTLARLRHEHSILRSLPISGVVQPVALEPCGNGLALVMEDVGESSLDSILRAGPVDVEYGLRIAVALAEALESIHRASIIHKDIKPHHVFVTDDGPRLRVKLVDFGLATQLRQETQPPTSPRLLEGTLAYLSPEQTGRMNRAIDQRSDLYSLGVTLFELLTGVLPFPATDALELVHSHIARVPPLAHEVRSAVPPHVSAIIARLLAKAAEDRYQTAHGVKADLERCLRQLCATGHIESFALAREDLSDVLRLPQKLYGREQESARLLAAFERIREGAVEVVLVRGYSGIGKSALVNELHRQIARAGSFISGKFDQLGRSIPYSAVMDACEGLVRTILTEPPPILGAWKRALLEALGPNGQVMIERIPELEVVIGAQPPVPELGPSESRSRFATVFQGFLRVFCTPQHPLVIFLDDLQWADPASLELVQHVASDARHGHLLIVGAYREKEVGPVHPLRIAREDLRARVPVTELSLGPLDAASLGHLVADTLRMPVDEVATLARLVLDKTKGNPFFSSQFLRTLHTKGLLTLDHATGAWVWDVDRIGETMATDNVIDLMVDKIQQLDPGAQRIIRLAACIGHTFDLETLALIDGRTIEQTAADLWSLLDQGSVVPLDSNYRYLRALAEGDADAREQELRSTYAFLHDRVQQAAYALIDDARRQEVHLRIGRRLLARHGEDLDGDALFDVLGHLDIGAPLIDDPEERQRLASLNLLAGRRARDAAAPAAASKFVGQCLSLLGERAWDHAELTYRAYLLEIECQYLLGGSDEIFALIDMLGARELSPLDRAALHKLEILVLTNLGRIHDAVDKGVTAAGELGIAFPTTRDPLDAALAAERSKALAALDAVGLGALVDLPLMTDPLTLAGIDMIHQTIPAVYQCNQPMMSLMVLRAVNLSIERGNTPTSCHFYMMLGAVLCAQGQQERGVDLGEVAIELHEKIPNPKVTGGTYFVLGAFVGHWRWPLSECIGFLHRSMQAGLDSGDILRVGYALSQSTVQRFFAGEPLDELLPRLADYQAQLAPIDLVNLRAVTIVERTVRSLGGSTHHPTTSRSDDFDEDELRDQVSANPFLLVHYCVFELVLHYHAGDHRTALVLAARAAAIPVGSIVSNQRVVFEALALAALVPDAAPDERGQLVEALVAREQTLRGWAEVSPANYAFGHRLVAASLAAIQDDQARAIDRFEESLALASGPTGGYHQRALASELYARFHLDRGRARLGQILMTDAHYAYGRWGAHAKAQQLRDRYGDGIVAKATSPGGSAHSTHTSTSTSSSTSTSGRLDLATALRATQLIAGELELEPLLEGLMRTVLENAAARRGFLVLHDDHELRIRAAITMDPDTVDVRMAQPLGDRGDTLAVTLVQYVARTRQPLLATDAHADDRFSGDPYVARARPRSLLGLPMLQQGRLVGVLYLENDIVPDAFTPARFELLQFLAVQSAVAVDNSRLYRQLQHHNQTLESQVAERTAKLRETLATITDDLEQARRFQQSVLPALPVSDRARFSAIYRPIGLVGGDIYDVCQIGHGLFRVFVADATGHGVQASMRTIVLKAEYDRLKHSIDTPSELLRAFNDKLIGLYPAGEMLCTGCCVDLRFSDDEATVQYANAAHLPLLHITPALIEEIYEPGPFLGISPNMRFPLLERPISPGHRLIVHTDGIGEGREPVLLSDLCRVPLSAQVPIDRVMEEMKANMESYARQLNDDVTVIGIDILEPGKRRAQLAPRAR